jgi:hypothetical protein
MGVNWLACSELPDSLMVFVLQDCDTFYDRGVTHIEVVKELIKNDIRELPAAGCAPG